MKFSFAALAASAVLLSTPSFAEAPLPVEARHGQFKILALNLGILGGIARGKIEYDAAVAQSAADSIVAVSTLGQKAMWVDGTSTDDLMETRAKPAIWENMADFESKWAALGEAATAMAAVAGTGKDAIGPNMGALGGACKACHDTYRAPE